jgi:hypothetical protein
MAACRAPRPRAHAPRRDYWDAQRARCALVPPGARQHAAVRRGSNGWLK